MVTGRPEQFIAERTAVHPQVRFDVALRNELAELLEEIISRNQNGTGSRPAGKLPVSREEEPAGPLH